MLLISCGCSSSLSGDPGQGAPQEQEAGVALPLQEEVGICGGVGAHRGGEGGGGGGAAAAAAAQPACIQAQEVFSLATLAAHLTSSIVIYY